MGFSFLVNEGSLVLDIEILGSGVLNINIPFILDIYRVVFGMVVIIISSCVILYNGFYIDGELFYDRFCKLVLLFVLSILFLVLIPNYLGLIVG